MDIPCNPTGSGDLDPGTLESLRKLFDGCGVEVNVVDIAGYSRFEFRLNSGIIVDMSPAKTEFSGSYRQGTVALMAWLTDLSAAEVLDAVLTNGVVDEQTARGTEHTYWDGFRNQTVGFDELQEHLPYVDTNFLRINGADLDVTWEGDSGSLGFVMKKPSEAVETAVTLMLATGHSDLQSLEVQFRTASALAFAE